MRWANALPLIVLAVAAFAASPAAGVPAPAARPLPVPPAVASAPSPSTRALGATVASGGPKHGRAERDANTCLTCHLTLPDAKLRQPAEQYAESVHRDQRIGCVGCHKGDPSDPTVQAHDPSTGFVVRPAHDEIAAICGGCHSNPQFVRRIDARLPVDQYQLYKMSVHGKLASAGDPGAPTCTDCHGVHAIFAPESPRSTVNRQNVVRLCAKCHADKQHMAPYGIPTDQVALWKRSVHGRAFESGSSAAPNCIGCHGPHAGAHPGSQNVAAACGYCHTEEMAAYLKSPHALAFRERGLSDCVPCHSNHAIVDTTWLAGMSPDSACSKCHSKSDKPKRVAEAIERVIDGVNGEEHSVRLEVARAQAAGLYVPDAVYALHRLHTAKLGLSVTTHTLDLQVLRNGADAVDQAAARARTAVQRAQREERIERRGYFVALALAVMLFALLLLKGLGRGRSRSAP
jgi:hypothetical protein